MFRITVRADGVSERAGPEAAVDIEQEFRDSRQWRQDVTCSYAGGALTLVATSDYDSEGLGLADELSDCVAAYVSLDDIADASPITVVKIETI